jgi:hypothetical protein
MSGRHLMLYFLDFLDFFGDLFLAAFFDGLFFFLGDFFAFGFFVDFFAVFLLDFFVFLAFFGFFASFSCYQWVTIFLNSR